MGLAAFNRMRRMMADANKQAVEAVADEQSQAVVESVEVAGRVEESADDTKTSAMTNKPAAKPRGRGKK